MMKLLTSWPGSPAHDVAFHAGQGQEGLERWDDRVTVRHMREGCFRLDPLGFTCKA